jgi:hypothetical protein
MSVQDKLNKTGPPQRKLLALDGGGIRGLISVEVLARVESLLQQVLGRDDTFVLADYFDYIAGTSTGAIIAACLAKGMRVSAVRDLYVESGKQMFDRARLLNRLKFQYNREPLAEMLKEKLGENTLLGSDEIKTLLMMVLRNATTDSPWPVSNNPKALFNDRDLPDCNLNFPLWQLVRASTAAPVFFPPEVIQVGDYSFVFVDGGMTMYNNPAFHLFLMATVEPYNLGWPTGEDKMLLVSVGTGGGAAASVNLRPDEMNVLYSATSIPSALMSAASAEQDFLCRTFGRCVAGEPIDREVGTMIGKKEPSEPKHFTYARYNAELTEPGLTRLGLPEIRPGDVQKLDSIEHIADLRRVGQAVAEQQVRLDHFDKFLA